MGENKEVKGFYAKLSDIQVRLKAPKNQKAKNYNYRSCEDIMTALKPYLAEHEMSVTLNDEVELIGDRYYIKATATLFDNDNNKHISTVAYAREEASSKFMSQTQLTGSASSYARKYALNGLLGIDDTKDSDYPHQEIDDKNKEKIDEAKAEALRALADKKGSDIAAMEDYYGMKVEQMDIDTYTHAVKSLEKRADKKG